MSRGKRNWGSGKKCVGLFRMGSVVGACDLTCRLCKIQGEVWPGDLRGDQECLVDV